MVSARHAVSPAVLVSSAHSGARAGALLVGDDGGADDGVAAADDDGVLACCGD